MQKGEAAAIFSGMVSKWNNEMYSLGFKDSHIFCPGCGAKEVKSKQFLIQKITQIVTGGGWFHVMAEAVYSSVCLLSCLPLAVSILTCIVMLSVTLF